MPRLVSLVLSFLAFGIVSYASAEDDPLHVRTQISLGAAMGNNVVPAPAALGFSVLVERRYFGVEAGLQLNPATLCEHGTSSDSSCGLLVTADVGPRVSIPITEHLVPYFSPRLQWLRMTEGHTTEFGVAVRLGLAYQGQRYGIFVEGGPTVLFGDSTDYPTVRESPFSGRSRRIVPMALLGVRL